MGTFSIELKSGILASMDIYAIRKRQLIKLIGDQKKGACALEPNPFGKDCQEFGR